MNTSNPCDTLSRSLLSLTALEKDIHILHERLLTEGDASLPAIEQALYAKKNELVTLEKQIRQAVEILEKANKQKSSDEIDKLLKNLGSLASLDRSFAGGMVSLKMTPDLRVKLQSYDTAIEALKQAYTTTVSIGSDIGKILKLPDVWTTITKDTLDILVTTDGDTTPQERDTLVAHMNTLGYRSLELPELIALGILKPEFTKDPRYEILNSMKKYSLGGRNHVPCLDGHGLSSRRSDVFWVGRERNLFVRK